MVFQTVHSIPKIMPRSKRSFVMESTWRSSMVRRMSSPLPVCARTGISDEAARKNCLACWKRVIALRGREGISLGAGTSQQPGTLQRRRHHPSDEGPPRLLGRRHSPVCRFGQGNRIHPRFKLLFDIYHVQIMNGDLIRNIDRYQEIVGHYHTAGNPGRRELDEDQEIYYPAVIRAIMKTGYRDSLLRNSSPRQMIRSRLYSKRLTFVTCRSGQAITSGNLAADCASKHRLRVMMTPRR